jgi:apolipoprotein N-acyltransferase
MGVAAAVFGLFGLAFLLATAAAALALVLSWWLSLLIVAGGLFLLAAIAGGIGAAKLRSGSPPIPEEAIREAKLTQDALKR